ncbi:efflux RND transporter periplasmic adaptor subunit [Reyranella sp. CPCC 100927]|uniref:efflux RND transporter periplasmic adaptor subunit n=1 Tax=Reyranella sp. CPCC 100927 TaxID=2599616 RepID=UPI0011B3AAF4|nr:efflux RND transporter periplasmic adaptor subunit [Reyranella sp. CPCC 100927]TWT05001.1 efflux RND transporter periplasmic adaptor subunit [Reyranella sp. CPCC 100927]
MRQQSIGVIVVLMLATAGIVAPPSLAAGEPAARHDTAPVVRGNVEDVVTALGSLQPSQYVDVGVQVSGQLQAIHVAIGDRVMQGQLVAEIEPTLYQARVTADRAALENLEAQLRLKTAGRHLLDRQLERQKEMLPARATSQEAYDAAVTALEQNSAEVSALEAQIRQTRANLGADEASLQYTLIHAPMAGTVVSLTARQGQTLNATQTAPVILRIANLDTMTVWTQVSEADIPKLTEGMDAYFTTLGRPNRRWSGTLRQILPTPEIVNNVVLYNALFDVDNRDKALLPSMSAQVFFRIRQAQDVLVVPAAALRISDGPGAGDVTLEVVQPDGKRVLRHVEVGVSNRVTAEIKSGVAPGERVIVPDAGTSVPGDSATTFRFKWPRL